MRELRSELVKLGLLTDAGYASKFSIMRRAEQLAAGVDRGVIRLCENLRDSLDRFIEKAGSRSDPGE
jgi:predicted hydrolase (HD superfamily)